jgi:hypothetical protein
VIGNPKPLLNAIPKIFGHTDKVVRSEGTLLVQQLHLFLGPSLTPFLQDLKPIQVAELTESFNALAPGGSGQPSRLTRKQQRETQERELSGAGGAGGGAGAEAEEDDEPLDIQPDAPPPVDVLPKIPADFFEMLGSTKWKDRLDALQAVHALITAAPLLIDADFSAHVQVIAKRIPSDANINVVIAAANVLEGLGKGLGPAFGKYRSTVMAPLLERLKERKANVTDALGAALDAAFENVRVQLALQRPRRSRHSTDLATPSGPCSRTSTSASKTSSSRSRARTRRSRRARSASSTGPSRTRVRRRPRTRSSRSRMRSPSAQATRPSRSARRAPRASAS